MVKVPEPLQSGGPVPPTNAQVPVILFPTSVPVRVSEFPAGELEVTTKLMEPSISFPVVVVRLEVPLSVSETKQGAFVLLAGSVLKLNSVMFKDPLLLTVKSMIKPSTAPEASPLPPAKVAPHKPAVTA